MPGILGSQDRGSQTLSLPAARAQCLPATAAPDRAPGVPNTQPIAEALPPPITLFAGCRSIRYRQHPPATGSLQPHEGYQYSQHTQEQQDGDCPRALSASYPGEAFSVICPGMQKGRKPVLCPLKYAVPSITLVEDPLQELEPRPLSRAPSSTYRMKLLQRLAVNSILRI